MLENSFAIKHKKLLKKSLFTLTEFTVYYQSLRKTSKLFFLSLYTAACLGTPTSLLICVQLILELGSTIVIKNGKTFFPFLMSMIAHNYPAKQ